MKINHKHMKQYTVLKTLKTRNGQPIVKEGDVLKHIPKYGNFDVYGLDDKNLFWTDDFLNSKPQLFKQGWKP